MAERRTQALATLGPRGEAAAGKGSVALLSFSLDGELYAAPLDAVQSIITVPELTDVPRSHACILGICSVRGVLATVIDLRRRLNLPERALTRQARILLTNLGEETLGLLVDGVHRVARVPPDQFEHTAVLIGEETTEHVAGIARVRRRDDWSALNALSNVTVSWSRGAATPGGGAERASAEEEETDVIVVLNLESVCRVAALGGRKS
jgi:purine-binding chemotaxis protein CheW